MYAEKNLITLEEPKSPVSEAYRVLRTNIQFSSVDNPVKSILITSAVPSEGKTSTICNLAIIFAQGGSKTLIIDADLRKPRIHKLFNLDNRKGLTNILALHENHKDYILKGPHSNLDIITCGAIPPNPSELLASATMKEFLKSLKDEYDYILVDSPPINAVTDAAILSSITDGTIIVAAVGEVAAEMLIRAKEQLDQVNANILGVVLNRVPTKGKSYYNYYYYYNYYTDAATGEKIKRKDKRKKSSGGAKAKKAEV